MVAQGGDLRQNIGGLVQHLMGDDLEVLGGQVVQRLGMGGEGAALGQWART